jgi:hypothetical protein
LEDEASLSGKTNYFISSSKRCPDERSDIRRWSIPAYCGAHAGYALNTYNKTFNRIDTLKVKTRNFGRKPRAQNGC